MNHIKKSAQLIFIVALAIALGHSIHVSKVHAQASATNSYAVSANFLLANCPASSIANTSGLPLTNFCSTGDGKQYECPSSATTCATATTAWVCIAGCPVSAAAGVTGILLNGSTTPLTGNVALTIPAGGLASINGHTGPALTITLAAPAISSSGSTATIGAPILTVTP